MMDDRVPALFLLGSSYPRDQFIEDALVERLPYRFLRYADLLKRHLRGRHVENLDKRKAALRAALAVEAAGSVLIFGRSSGARVATLVAAEGHPKIAAIVALGYPFRHPKRPTETGRVEHLANLATPTLILQGARDEYGGREAASAYCLSPAVVLSVIDTDHHLDLGMAGWAAAAEEVQRFVRTLDGLIART